MSAKRCEHETEAPARTEAIDVLSLRTTPDPLVAGQVMVARCIDTRHPTLAGRVQVEIVHDGRSVVRWLATLREVVACEGDQLLVTKPANGCEPIVTGVVDGFEECSRTPRAVAALTLKHNEALCIAAEDGQPLVEILGTPTGPVVRLLQKDLDVELAGALRLSAASIELTARRGEIRVEASADVVVEGETIQLN